MKRFRIVLAITWLLIATSVLAQSNWSAGNTLRTVDSYPNNAWANLSDLDVVFNSVDDLSDETGMTKEAISAYKKKVALAKKQLPPLVKNKSVATLKNGQRLIYMERQVLVKVNDKFTLRPATPEEEKAETTVWLYRVKIKNGPLKDRTYWTQYVKPVGPEDGESCVMTNATRGKIPAAFEEDTLSEIFFALDKGDNKTVEFWLMGERAFAINQGTRVAIADRTGLYYQVRILSGPAKGKLLYVYARECEFTVPDPNAK